MPQTGGECSFADHRLGPHRVEQGLFAHHLPGLAGQQPEHRQRFGRQRHHLSHATTGHEAPPGDRAQNTTLSLVP